MSFVISTLCVQAIYVAIFIYNNRSALYILISCDFDFAIFAIENNHENKVARIKSCLKRCSLNLCFYRKLNVVQEFVENSCHFFAHQNHEIKYARNEARISMFSSV